MDNIIKIAYIIALIAVTITCASYTYYHIQEVRIDRDRSSREDMKYLAWVQDRADYLRRVEEAKARKEAEEKAWQEKKEARARQIEAEKAGKK